MIARAKNEAEQHFAKLEGLLTSSRSDIKVNIRPRILHKDLIITNVRQEKGKAITASIKATHEGETAQTHQCKCNRVFPCASENRDVLKTLMTKINERIEGMKRKYEL